MKWWPWSKKEKEKEVKKAEVKPIEYEIQFVDQKFEVGKTTIRLTFANGKAFNCVTYGSVDQFYRHGYRGIYSEADYSPLVDDPKVMDSIFTSKVFLNSISTGEGNYVNDGLNPTEVRIGKVVSAKIVKTEKYETTFSVAKVVAKPEEPNK